MEPHQPAGPIPMAEAKEETVMTALTEERKLSILRDLDAQGYAVIPDVISQIDCDVIAGKFNDWLRAFSDGEYPKNRRSVIHGYGVAHMDPTWRVRLKAKAVFEAIYNTPKLLTSTDGVAILPPPSRDSDFDTGTIWLHCDQSCDKVGNHAFQGAVYLEETTADDYCLRVLKNSHKLHHDFFNDPQNARAKRKSKAIEFCKLTKAEQRWFLDRGCPLTPVGVPRGGMVVWDSRTIHDTKKPSRVGGRRDRWRMLTFVSMAPALWANQKDLVKKREAYTELATTAHWASCGVTILRFLGEGKHANNETVCLKELPPIAKSKEVLRLVGMEPYDFEDGRPNGPPRPHIDDSCNSCENL